MTADTYYQIVGKMGALIKGTKFENHVFAVGGCVRDLLMGHEIQDVDLCVDMPDGALRLADFLQANGCTMGWTVKYPAYGTAMFRLPEFPDQDIEAAQTRGELYADDSRNPVTAFASIEEDCARRDLTINALYMDVNSREILDLTGKGLDDIRNGVCRVTNGSPDVVFADDPLRILRVIRFACRYGFRIEDATWKAMIRNVDRLGIITRERITDEFNKMMMTDSPAQALGLLRDCGAMKHAVPEFIETYGMGQNAFHFGTVWEHTLGVVENNAKACGHGKFQACLPVRLACAFHDLGKISTRTVGGDGRVHFYGHETIGADLVRGIMVKMRYSNAVIDEVCFYVRHHMVTKAWGNDLSRMKMKTLRKLMYNCKSADRFFRLMSVIDADNNAHKKGHCLPDQVTNIVAMVTKDINDNTSMFSYKLPINGHDVMAILGIAPGPAVKIYLDHCMKLAFNNPDITKDQCVNEIKHFKITNQKDM